MSNETEGFGEEIKKQQTVNNPVEAVVMRQFRYCEQNEYCVDFGEWGAWTECDIIKFNDINRYISQGYKYETRELIVKAS